MMKIAVIGRTEILYNTALLLADLGHEIVCILTAKQAPEYTRTIADFKKLSQKWHIPFAHGSNISKHSEFFRTVSADIAISMNYPGIVPQLIIDLFPLGILNIHGGDLPRYRGNACQAWAILNAEKRIGLCVHKMIGGELDSGDIVARKYLPIDHQTKVTQVWEWIRECTPKLMLEAIECLSVNSNYVLERQSKNPTDALRCYPRRPEDGRIDWHESAINILRLINATNKPYSGAFCEYEGEKLIIWDAELIKDNELLCAVPGQVTKISDGCVEVACGKGKLRLLQVEFREHAVVPSVLIKSIRKRFL